MYKYEKQAREFLQKNDCTINIEKAVPQEKPLWCKEGEEHGIHYIVTISRNVAQIQFPFWGSIRDKEDDKVPTVYDILACINYEEVEDFEDFEDFCSEYGYSNDSITALRTYEAVQNLNKKLKSFFSDKELEELQEIA